MNSILTNRLFIATLIIAPIVCGYAIVNQEIAHGLVLMPIVENGKIKELKFDDFNGYVDRRNGQSTWTNSKGETRVTAMNLIFKADEPK